MSLTRPLLLKLEDKPPIELRDITKIGSLGNLDGKGNLIWIKWIELGDIPGFHRLVLLPRLLHPAQRQVEAMKCKYK